MQQKKLIKILSYSILFFLFIPLIQSNFKLFKEKKLNGYFKPVDPINFSISFWMDGVYQKKKEAYLKSNFGFRQSLLPLWYQWLFDMYSMSRLNACFIGKDNYLFQTFYSNADRGLDFIGDSLIQSTIKKTKIVNQKLASEGIHLFILISPSKTLFYPEYIPESYLPEPNVPTNYKGFLKGFKKDSIPFIDMNSWFLALKDTIKFPLYPKTGIHYSSYGAAIVADSMLRYLGNTMDKDIPDLFWNEVEWSNVLRDEDKDMEWAMNLIWQIPNKAMAYPKIQINETGKYKPNILTVGDSYFWRFYRWGGLSKVYNNSEFLYYNREVYPGKKTRKTYELSKELKALDAICIYINPSGLDGLFWGFIDDLYNYYQSISKEAIDAVKQTIISNPTWFKRIQEKAILRSISVDSMLYIDAKYYLQNKAN
ncbi:MAG: hypothetical protein MK207_08775 [Saprospiraceae bacterium]|nr:hypothetical protein [Saprospiraceae bacterium]